MQRRVILAIAGVLVLAVPGRSAPLDPGTKDPYPWRIVLAAGRHPILSPAFRDQLARDVRAALQGTTGPVAAVEVIDLAAVPADQWDPLWKLFAEKGWPALDPDPNRLLTGVKTHVLKVEYRDGQFHLEAKQHDGFTGLATPLVRKQTVRSADMVGRLAGLMLEPDFCPAGTVDVNPDDPDHVTVTLRGSGVGSLDRYVKLGRVFAVSLVLDRVKGRGPPGKPDPTPAGRTAQQIEWTLLKVIDPVKDGACKCRVLTRWQQAFTPSLRRAAGVRCLLLPTAEAPVKLRLVGRDGNPHPRGSLLQVAATDSDFAAKPGTQDNFTFRDGVYESARAFAQVACVQVALGAGAPKQFPVAVLGGDAVTIRFDIKPEDEARALFERACNDLRGKVADASLAQVALFEELNRLIKERRNREALARAEAGVVAAEQAYKALAEELKHLREDPQAGQGAAQVILQQVEDRLNGTDETPGLVKSQQVLGKHVAALKEAVKASTDPIRVEKELRQKELAERIREYVNRGDIPEALDAYDQLIILLPNQQELKDQREKLQVEWAPKDEEHRKARESFIGWTKAKSAAEFKEAVGPLRAAAEVFMRKRDKLGLLKMLRLIEPALGTIKVLTEAADTNTEDGQQAIKDLEAVVGDVRQTETDAREYLKRLAGK